MNAFEGKWRLTQGKDAVQVDASGTLLVQAQPSDGSDRFNAYGDAQSVVLQSAVSGKYLLRTGTTYAASAADPAQANSFELQTVSGSTLRLLDIGVGGTGPKAYWDTAGGKVTAGPATKSTATTDYLRSEVTPGLAGIRNGDLPDTPDMRWVNISGADLNAMQASDLDFDGAPLGHADFSGCIFPPNVSFNQAHAKSINLSQATIPSANCGSTDFTSGTLDGVKMQSTNFGHAVLDGVTASNADFSENSALFGATIFSVTSFKGATLDGAKFKNATTVADCDFTGASLRCAVFTTAQVQPVNDFSGADLTGAQIDNTLRTSGPSKGDVDITIYPGALKVDARSNFTDANLSHVSLKGYDLRGIVFTGATMIGMDLGGTKLDQADLAYAVLDGSVMTGTVTLHGANLSNASLRDVDLSAAQLGALSVLFAIKSGSSAYTAFLNALKVGNGADVGAIFAQHGTTLNGTITVAQSRHVDTNWTVSTTAASTVYEVDDQQIGGAATLVVGTPTTPAVLSNAFLVNTKFNNANLIGVNASGAALYAIQSGATGMNTAQMRGMQLSNANLSNQSFAGVSLAGVNFDFATLTNANFSGGTIATSPEGTRTSFNGANLVSANFDGRAITNAVFTNAVFGVGNPLDPNSKSANAGAWLFTIPPGAAATVKATLYATESEPGQTPSNLFSFPVQALPFLQKVGVPDTHIVGAFSKAGVTLTKDAVLTISASSPFWQLSDGAGEYVIFDTVDRRQSPQPALGVATGTAYATTATAYLPLSLQTDLIAGQIKPALQAALAQAGIKVSAQAVLKIAQTPTDWQIVNGGPEYEVYSLWLDMTSTDTQITVRPALSPVISAFADFSTAISRRSTVVPLKTTTTRKKIGWILDNNASDPFNPVVNYIIYNILPNPAGGLDVYGAVMRIKRLSAAGETSYYNIIAGITEMDQSQLSGAGNVCPNGDFAATNAANKLPFNQWLQARVPPRPPLCVPDPLGGFTCPV